MMRALTVRQPWAWAIVHGGKDVENRTCNIAGAYRGPVAIHAGKHPTDQDAVVSLLLDHDVDAPSGLAQGLVIGVVDVVDVHHADWCWDADHWDRTNESRWCTPWAQDGQHHIVLANPRPLAEPIRARGFLSLWTLPADVEAAVRSQVHL